MMTTTSRTSSFRSLGATLLVSGLLFASSAHAQIATPQASPKSTIQQRVGLTDVTITYSRPSLRGRVGFGEGTTAAVVPFGQRWRTGANATTSIKFSDDVTIEGKKVPAGEYGIYTIPGKASWTVVLNKSTKAGADVASFKDDENVASFTVKPSKLPTKVETFTINFTDLTPATATVDMQWETTSAKFRIMTDVESKVMAQIDEKVTKSASPSNGDLAAAAVYYFDNDKDLKQALTWMQKANATDPKFWNLHTEAKIRMKMKDYKGAVTAAEQSKKLATEAKNTDYVKMNEMLIVSANNASKKK
ncbi:MULTISPECIES: DUF2911 domain-containing protein [Hymenobacter]|uniref:DUF2911 domain-containing protein n=1 Tax=Hymenobacter mucosus TaxID=1411120 RepID=A0A238YN45_9BACT|nr:MULTISPECIES: DUF2911 domain-containing protein [Hymenobacter]SNR72054.1 Protein of unknown function [Hymenobacter mucosus]